MRVDRKVIEGKKVVHNVYILDASGSMHGAKYNNAVSGIKDEIEQLKFDNLVDYTITVVEFDHVLNIRKKEHLFLVPSTGNINFIPCGANGGTPLYQAVGETLEKLVSAVKPGEKVLVNIFTDGEENASSGKYTKKKILSNFIEEVQTKGFTVTFIGTKQDVEHVVDYLNIDESNTLVHDNTAKGIQRSFKIASTARVMYSKAVADGEDVSTGFYKKVVENN